MADEHIFVVDIGSSSVKAGYSGEDVPSYVFPSTTSSKYDKEAIEVYFFMFFIVCCKCFNYQKQI
jgi:actin-related protein